MVSLFQLTQASLSQLRKHEWLWRLPESKLTPRQRWFQILDPLCLGHLSRFDLKRAKRGAPGLQDEEIFFAWVCSAIEINNRFAEAYVWRSLSGNEIFCTRGRIPRLQGWQRNGVECYYDVDSAVVDVLIASALKPKWDWALRANGVMAFVKAIRLVEDQKAREESSLWAGFAKHRLSEAVQLATRKSHWDLKRKTERLIWDLDHWSEYGFLPEGSEVGELYER
jgi:hypothetical protein